MSGLTFEECRGWRLQAKEVLEAGGKFKTLDPCRGKEYLSGLMLKKMDEDGQGWGDVIVPRDKYDVTRSDVILFNFLDAPKVKERGGEGVSIGTIFELAWAREYGKFSLVVMQPGNPNDHEFVRKHSSLIVPDLGEAYAYLLDVLNA
jgi:hypothetical protein